MSDRKIENIGIPIGNLMEHDNIASNECDFYGSELKDYPCQTTDNLQIKTLGELYLILRKCWSKETAYPACQSEWVPNDPTYGQCAITAMLVYDLFGGSIHRIHVNGGGTHYFNKLGNQYVDLTRQQFDLYNIPVEYEPNDVINRVFCGKNENTQKRFELLVDNIKQYLASRK